MIKSFRPVFIISMYDEHDFVRATIMQIHTTFPKSCVIVVQSDDGNQTKHGDIFIKLPNLKGTVDDLKLPANAICRNFARGFQELYNSYIPADIVVALTGDTMITDATAIYRRYGEMVAQQKLAAVCQPIGQRQHSADGTLWGTLNAEDSTSFICCLFMFNGEWATDMEVFKDIPVVNEYTSEECLGTQLAKELKAGGCDWKQVLRLNSMDPLNCYSYIDGIVWHAKTGKPGR